MSSVGSNAPESRHLALLQASIIGAESRIRTLLAEAPWTTQADQDTLRTALQRIAALGDESLTRQLLDKGAEINSRRTNEVGALFRATENGRANVVQVLLHDKADVEGRDRKGRTALFPAVLRGDVAIVKMLLEAGADVDARDAGGRTPLIHLVAERMEKTEGKAGGKGRKGGAAAAVVAEKAAVTWSKELEVVVDMLLRKQVNADAQDNTPRTALMWAAATGWKEFADLLLSGRYGVKADIQSTQNTSKTALHFAAERGHEEISKLLLDHGADPNAVSNGGWTALHITADKNHLGTLRVLLASGAYVNAELTNGMTALHWAAFNGSIDIVKELIKRPETNLTIKDSDDRTPMLCAAERSHLDVVRLLSPAHNGHRLPKSAQDACRGFEATVVDFGMDRKAGNQRVFKHKVYDLLYAWEQSDSTRARIPVAVKNVKHAPVFRWIHLPANNVAWVETLLAKHFVENGARDVDSYKALSKCFRQEHRGPTAHSYFMRTSCHKMKLHVAPSDPEPPSKEEKKLPEPPVNPLPIIIEPTPSGSTTPVTPRRPSLSIEKDSTTESTSPITPAPPGSPALSATGEKKKKQTKSEKLAERHAKKPKREPSGDGNGNKPAKAGQTPAKQSRNPPKGTRKPSGPTIPKLPVNAGNVVLFMPYLHYETDEKRYQMSEAIKRAKLDLEKGATQRKETPDSLLVEAYLPHSPPLHIRRTLDQFFYHGIDTSERDRDQVVYRYCKRHNLERKIFMVDQLWLWVVGNDLVITCFPQRWQQPKNDPLNVLDGIVEDMNAKTRPPLKTVFDLAMLITSRCSGMFDRHRLENEEYQFLDMFESSIGRVTNRETKLFDRFNHASAAAAKWLRVHRQSRGRGSLFSATPDALPHRHDKHAADPRFQDALLDIGIETALLSETKDIRDELSIIRMVLEYQKAVLADFGEHIGDELGRRTDESYEFGRRSREQLKIIEIHVNDLRRMDSQARSIYESLTNLLDLKQKHANAFEARFARDQAALTARQGQTILVFTLTTILFLPMSFIAAFFQLNINDFPRIDGGLSLGYVSKYMFGIGLGISIPLIIIAFAVEDVSELLRRCKFALARALATMKKGRRKNTDAKDVRTDSGLLEEFGTQEETKARFPRPSYSRDRRAITPNGGYAAANGDADTLGRKSYEIRVRDFSPPLLGRIDSGDRHSNISWNLRRSLDVSRERRPHGDDVERGLSAYSP